MNNHFTIQRQVLFAPKMRQSLYLHEALPNIAITSENSQSVFHLVDRKSRETVAIKYIFRGIEVYE